MDKPAALLFDMDGLLLDTERAFLRVFLDLTAPLGIAAERAEHFFLGLVGLSAQKTTEALETFIGPHTEVAAFDRAWRAAFAEHLAEGVPLRPGVGEAIPEVAGTGIPMAVVTSSKGAVARHHLKVAGLLEHFAHIVPGDEVPATKPDPAPYLQAARLLGVDPGRAAAFEDSDTGTTAATRAGCRTYQIPDLRPPGLRLPDLGQIVVDSLPEALAHLGLRSG